MEEVIIFRSEDDSPGKIMREVNDWLRKNPDCEIVQRLQSETNAMREHGTRHYFTITIFFKREVQSKNV